MLTVYQKPFRIWRSDGTAATGQTVAPSPASIDSNGAPSYGWSTVTLYFNTTASVTVNVFEKTRSSPASAFAQTFTSGAFTGVYTKVLSIFGENIKIQLVNNDAASQIPEFIVTLNP